MKSKLKKIKTMLSSSFEGERNTAQKMLDELMQKYDINPEDLEERQWYEFSYFNKFEESLLTQIVGKVLNTSIITFRRNRQRKRRIKYKLSPTEAEQVKSLYKLCRAQFKKELEYAMKMAEIAFYQKNDIFVKDGESNESPDIDYELLAQLYAISKKMQNVIPKERRLENNGT